MGKTKQRCFIKSLSLKRFMTFAVMLCMLFSAVLMPAAYASEYDVSIQSEDQVLANGVYYLKKNGSYLASSLLCRVRSKRAYRTALLRCGRYTT